MDEIEPKQRALFKIKGLEDGCVWICSVQPTDNDSWWCQNLGPADKVAEVLSQWLGSINYGENS